MTTYLKHIQKAQTYSTSQSKSTIRNYNQKAQTESTDRKHKQKAQTESINWKHKQKAQTERFSKRQSFKECREEEKMADCYLSLSGCCWWRSSLKEFQRKWCQGTRWCWFSSYVTAINTSSERNLLLLLLLVILIRKDTVLVQVTIVVYITNW